LRRRSEEAAVNHMTAVRRHEDVTRLQETRALPLIDASGITHAIAQAVRSDHIVDEMIEVAFADQQERRLWPRGANAGDRRREHIDTMPPTERAGESDDAIVGAEAQLFAQRLAFGARRGRVRLDIGPIGI